MEFIFWFFYLILALLIGSFLNVVAFRIPMGESLLKPASYCPSCNHNLSFFDKLPIISYLKLRGKCRYCHTKISLIYPVGELLTLITFILIPVFIGFSAELVIAYLFSLIMITVTISDIRYKIIPDKIVYPGILLIFILRLLIHPIPFWNYILGAVIFGGFLLLVAIISRGGMGGGDIKLFFLIGLALGWQDALLALFLASLSGTIFGAILLLTGKIKKRELIPFGPFIFIGTMIAYFLGKDIWHWYISNFI